MKKFVSVLVCIVMLALTCIPVFAWETPALKLEAAYNESKNEITVSYRILDLSGTESADFRLKYDSSVVELENYEAHEPGDSTLIEIGEKDDEIYIQFIDIYHVEPEDCEEDGSAVIATFTFKLIDENAAETVFIATCGSCNMDPDSAEVTVKRDTLKLNFDEAASETADESVFENENVKKIIIAGIIALVVFVGALTGIVIKYRKKED